MPGFYYYGTSARLTERCCLEITVTHPYGYWSGSDSVEIVVYNRYGDIATASTGEYIGPNNDYVFTVCDLPDGEDVFWTAKWARYNDPYSVNLPIGNGRISADMIQKCKFNNPNLDTLCPPGCTEIPWIQHSKIIVLDEFPGCPLIYTYWMRRCGDEIQIKGGKISVLFVRLPSPSAAPANTVIIIDSLPYRIDCWDVLNYLYDGYFHIFPPPGDTFRRIFDQQRLESIFEAAFKKLSDSIFNELVAKAPATHLPAFDCNNINLPGVIPTVVTYYKGDCVSYCASVYYDRWGNLQFDYQEDDCTNGNACCRYARTYCLDFNNLDSNGNPSKRVTESRDVIYNGLEYFGCDPNALPSNPSCVGFYYNNHPYVWPDLFYYRSPCTPSCKPSDIVLKEADETETVEPSDFQIYPNPAKDQLNVSFANGNVNRIEIVDNSGRVYIVLSIDSKDTEAKISLSGLVRGSYYIMIRDNNNILRYKQFIKE